MNMTQQDYRMSPWKAPREVMSTLVILCKLQGSYSVKNAANALNVETSGDHRLDL